MEERTKKTLEECKKLELKLSEAEKEKKNVEKKYAQVLTDLLPMHLRWKLKINISTLDWWIFCNFCRL